MRVVPIPTLEAARAPWESLEGAAGSIFSTWEWASTWWQTYGHGKQLELYGVYDGDRLAAILPLYRTAIGPAPVLRMVGHGPADELGPVCDPSDLEFALGALGAVARDTLPSYGLTVVDRLREHRDLPTKLLGSSMRLESSPTLPREGRTWEEWLATRSSNFRQEIRRREKRLLRDHGLVFRQTDDPARLDDDFDTLLALFRARWADVQTTAFEPRREAFHRAFVRRAIERGWLRLWIAETDGRPTAAWYGFRFAGDEWYYQGGRDPSWNRFAVGTVLLAHTIRSAFEDGVDVYRFGVGDEPYKMRFASCDPTLLTAAVGRRVPAVTAAAAARALARIPPGLRRSVTRRVT